MLVIVACVAAYMNLWKVHRETMRNVTVVHYEWAVWSERRAAAANLSETGSEVGSAVMRRCHSRFERRGHTRFASAAQRYGHLSGLHGPSRRLTRVALKDRESRVRAQQRCHSRQLSLPPGL